MLALKQLENRHYSYTATVKPVAYKVDQILHIYTVLQYKLAFFIV